MYEATMLANFLLWLAMLIVFLSRRSASIFHPFFVYLVFHFVVFAGRAPLVYYRGYDFIYRLYEFQPTDDEKTKALLVAMLGLICFGATCLHYGRSELQLASPANVQEDRRRLLVPLMFTALLLAPIAVSSMLTAWTERATGMSSMINDRETGLLINSGSNGYFYESRAMLGPICLIFAWITRFRWYSLLPMLVFLVLGGGAGIRGPFMLAAAGFGLLWMYQQRRLWPTPAIAGLLLGVMVFFSNVGVDRGEFVRQMFQQQQVHVNTSYYANQRFMEGMDTGNLEYLEYVVRAVPAKTGTYSYFTGLLQIFTEPIPRVLWPSKPAGAPIRMFNFFDYGNPVGMTVSLPGQGWADLGWAGVALWCGLFGAFWGAVYERFASRPITSVRLLAYMILLPVSILFFRDGTPVSMLRFGLFLTIPLALFSLFAWLARTQAVQPGLAGAGAVSGAARRAQRAAQGEVGHGAGRDNRRRLASQLAQS